MVDEAITDLLRRAPFSFVGTVEHLAAATMTDLPIDERTAVVRIDHVLHAPDAFAGLEGHRATLQLAAGSEPPQPGESAAFFAEGVAFGETVALAEVGRLPVEEVEPHLTAAAERGDRGAFEPLRRSLRAEELRAHAAEADAVVVGQVTALQSGPSEPAVAEHDPDWWTATIAVEHVERGNLQPGPVAVAFPNSHDIAWAKVPKPRPAEYGVWILHATEGELAKIAPYQIVHADDRHSLQSLDAIRAQEG
jgi:hypothetical protein